MDAGLPWVAIGVVSTAYLALLGYMWSLSQKIADGDQRLHSRVDKLVTDLGAYQTEAARTYASRDEINQRLERIETKLDRLAERN